MRKYSKQRAEVLRVAKENLIHPTADEIYSIVRKEDPSISLGTVYRNLNVLAEDGEILRIPVPGDKDRYDGRADMHYHVICRGCMRVFDFDYKLENLKEEVMNQCGIETDAHTLMIYGLCENCRANKG